MDIPVYVSPLGRVPTFFPRKDDVCRPSRVPADDGVHAMAYVSPVAGQRIGAFERPHVQCLDQFLSMAIAQITYRESPRGVEEC